MSCITSPHIDRHFVEQTEILLHTPILLNSMLNITMSRNWLLPTTAAMRLHAYLTQALIPGKEELKAAQLPGITPAEAPALSSSESSDFSAAVSALSKSQSSALLDAEKALERLGQTEIVDASFKVIGERYVTPSSFVHLLVKLRVVPLSKEGSVLPIPKQTKESDKRDNEFLLSKKDTEDLPQGDYTSGYAHAPYWPAVSCKSLILCSAVLMILHRTVSRLGGSCSLMSSRTRLSSHP